MLELVQDTCSILYEQFYRSYEYALFKEGGKSRGSSKTNYFACGIVDVDQFDLTQAS